MIRFTSPLLAAFLITLGNLLLPGYAQAQVIITSETFDEPAGSLSGTMSGGQPWTAAGNSCDATGFFGTNGTGAFACTDYEGFTCCDCVGSNANPAGTCGDASNIITLGPIDISAYHHISIDVFASQSGDLECVVGSNPNAACPPVPNSGCNGGNDQMVFTYSINGGADVVYQYYCGDNALCYSQAFACNISGNTLSLKVLLGTQATGETYLITDIIVYGYPQASAIPTVNGQASGVAACQGSVVNLTETSPTNNTSYQWSGPGLSNANIKSPTATLPNTTGTVTYSVTTTDQFGCTATGSVNVDVLAPPTVDDPPNQTVCVGSPVTVNFTGTNNPVFNWTNNNTAIGLPASGSGDISFTAANVAAPTTATVTVTAGSGSCVGPPQTFTITVNPGPTVNPPANQSVCGGSNVTVNFTGTPGATFAWTNDNPAIGLGASGSGSSINFTTTPAATDQVANITVTPSNGPCPGTPQTFTITVKARPTVDDPPNQTVCAGANINVAFTGSGNPTFAWTNSNTNIGLGASGSGDLNFTAASVGTTQTGVITVTPSANGCPGLPQNFTVTVNPAPTVNALADVTACSGQNVIANFSGTGASLFTWTNNNPAIGLGAGGTGNISFTAANVGTSQTGTISVTPSNASCNGTPASFEITINPGPSADDPANESVCAGQAVSVNLTGTPGATFNWTNSNTAIGLGASGTGDIGFTSANVATTQTATITVTPSLAGCIGPVQTFTVTVSPAPTVNQPANQNVCNGNTVNVNFTGSAGAGFTWTNDNPAIGLGASGTGNINFTAIGGAGPQTATITVTPTAASGGCTGTDKTFTITVNPGPTTDPQSDLTSCAAQPVSVNFTGTPGATFNWTNSNPAIGLPASGSGNISFTTANVATAQLSTITVTPSAAGCTGMPETFTITVNPTPTVNQPANQNTCNGNTVNVNFTGSAGTSFTWTNDNPAIGLGASGTGNISFTAIGGAGPQTATITVTPTAASGGCTGIDRTFTITVNPGPTVNAQTDLTSCALQQVNVDLTGSAGATLNWTNSNPAIGLPAAGSGDILFNTANVATVQVATITVTPTAAGCTGATETFTITVNPTPNVNLPANVNACSGLGVNVNFTGTAGATFTWTNNNPAIGLGASGTGNINFTSALVTGPETATITVTPEIGGCVGSDKVFSITVNPGPSLDPLPNLVACAQTSVSQVFTGTGSPTVSWTNSNPAIGLPASGTGNINFTAANVGTQQIASITATPSTGGCTGPAEAFTITVNPRPTVVQPANVTVCNGELINVNFTGNGSPTYNWTNSNPAIGLPASGNGDLDFTAATVAAATTATITVTPEANGCTGTPIIFTITVNPGVSVNNPGAQGACIGEAVQVNFTGTGNPTFTWTNSNPAIGLAASGSGNISFTAANVTSATTGTITVTPNGPGCNGASQTFTITVSPGPSMTPPADKTTCGGTATSVVFSGTSGTTYNWTNSNPAIGLPASGSGNLNFTAANSGTTLTGTITVTPSIGACVGTPQTFTVTVNPAPTVTPVADQTFCSNTSANIVFSGTGSPTFAWTNSNPAVGLPASGTGNITFTTASVSALQIAQISVTPSAAGCTGTPVTFSLRVTPAPTVDQPANVTVCNGQAVNVSFTGTGSPVFNWTNTNPAIGLAASGSGNISFTSAGVTTVQTATITVTPEAAGCTGTPATFTITVNPGPTVNDPGDTTVCVNQAVAINFTGSGNPTLSWTNSNPSIGLGPNGTGNISFTSASVAAPTTGTITVTPSGAGCAGSPVTFTITVSPSPSMTPPADLSACSGSSVNTSFGGTAGATFVWTNSDPSVGLPATGSGNLSFTAVTTGTPLTSVVTVSPVLGGCTGPSNTFNVTVNPLPTVNAVATQTACAGSPVTVNFTGSAGATYSWTNNNPNIGLPASGTGDISFTSANVTSPENALIIVTPSANGCTGTVKVFNIQISPKPTVTKPADKTACSGEAINIPFTGTGTATYTWTNSNPNIGLPATGTGNLDFAAAVVTTTETATITVKPVGASCTGDSVTFTITVNPGGTVNDPADQTVCVGKPVSVVFTGTGTSTFTWTNSNPAIGLPASGTGDINFTSASVVSTTTATLTVSPGSGACAGGSQTFTISINPAPVMTPPANLNACSGETVSTTFGGTAGAVFNWTNDNPAIGLPASGSGNITFTAANLAAPATANVTVTPSINGCDGTPQVFQVQVFPPPTVADPVDQTLCSGSAITVNFTGTNNPTFNWTNSNPAIGLPASGTGNISGMAAVVGTQQVAQLTVVPISGTCTGPVQLFTIRVNPAPTMTQPADVTVCNGQSVNVPFTGAAGTTFSWTNSNPLIGPASGTGDLSFTSLPVTTQQTATITVTPTVSGCTGTPVTFTITVNPGAAIANPGNLAACLGDPIKINFSGAGNPTVNWTNSNPAIGLPASGTGNIDLPATSTPGVATITATPSGAGCVGAPQTFTLTINALPSVNAPTDLTVCPAGQGTLAFTGSSGASFAWTNSNAAIGLPTSGTGNIAFTASNPALTQTAVITVTPSANGCTGQSQSATITVNPAPAVTPPGNQTVCGGLPVSINFTGSLNAGFNWTNSNTAIGLPATGTGNIAFNAQLSAIPQTATITVTPSAAGCNGTPQNFTLTVNPTPTAIQPANDTICAGQTASVDLNGTAGANFIWTNSNPQIGLGPVGSGNINFTAAEVTTPQIATISVTPQAGSCAGAPVAFNLRVNPLPSGSITGNQTICGGASTVLTATGGTSYAWSSGTTTATTTVTPAVTSTYVVTLTAADGCTNTVTATVNVETPVKALITGDTIICTGENTDLTASGGANFIWNTGAFTPSISVNPDTNAVYNVIVNNGGACADTTEINIQVFKPVTTNITTKTCVPSQIGVFIKNLKTQYDCDSTVVTVVEFDPSAIDTTVLFLTTCDPTQVGSTQNLLIGADQCDSLVITNTVVGTDCAPTATVSTLNPDCAGNSSGAFVLRVPVGIAPFQYTWIGPAGNSGNGQLVNPGDSVRVANLPAGNYSVTVTGQNGVTTTVAFALNAPPAVDVTATALNTYNGFAIGCAGDSTGRATAAANGGTPPYSFSWSTGDTGASVGGLPSGLYTLTATDQTGCTDTASVTLSEPPSIRFNLLNLPTECGDTLVDVTVVTDGGVPPFSVKIDGNVVAGTALALAPGEHIVELVDANGCTISSPTTIYAPELVQIKLPADTVVRYGDSLVITAFTNLPAWQSLVWKPVPTDGTANSLTHGWKFTETSLLTVTIRDSAGCAASDQMLIIVDNNVNIFIPNVVAPGSTQFNDKFIITTDDDAIRLEEVSIFDRWGDYVYQWKDTPISPNFWLGWDGRTAFKQKDADLAVFVYIVKVRLRNGEVLLLKGDVTVMDRD